MQPGSSCCKFCRNPALTHLTLRGSLRVTVATAATPLWQGILVNDGLNSRSHEGHDAYFGIDARSIDVDGRVVYFLIVNLSAHSTSSVFDYLQRISEASAQPQ